MNWSLVIGCVALSISATAGAASGAEIQRVEIIVRSGEVSLVPSPDGQVHASGAKVTKDASGVSIRSRNEDLTVKIPKNAFVSLKSRSGDIKITGVYSKVDVATISGDIRLEAEATGVEVSTLSGDLFFAGMFKEIRGRTVSGSIDVQCNGVPERARLKATSGDVVLRCEGLPARIEAAAVNGTIRLEGGLRGDARVELVTVSGDIEVAHTNQASYALEARTRSGEVTVEGKRLGNSAHEKVRNGAGAEISAVTMSGDIDVTSAAAKPKKKK